MGFITREGFSDFASTDANANRIAVYLTHQLSNRRLYRSVPRSEVKPFDGSAMEAALQYTLIAWGI